MAEYSKSKILKHLDSLMICVGNAYDTSHYLLESDMIFIEHQEKCIKELLSDSQDVQPIVNTENMAIVSDEFICKKCGIYLKDYIKVVMDEDNDGYIDEQHYDYEPKFCPECGAKVESCIKTPKRDKPLYTMDEICKMNGVEFKGGEQNDKTRNV